MGVRWPCPVAAALRGQGGRCLGRLTLVLPLGISYRELEEMMGERGVAVDHTTVYRWTQRYAPEAGNVLSLVPQPAVVLLAG